jgi:hypothetical protein
MGRSRQSTSNAEPYFDSAAPDELQLDAKNPRLAEFGVGDKPTQDELLELLWQSLAVDEVAFSIATRGFYSHEPLFVTKENGKDVVIEGNRRLAAVKILLSPQLRERLGIRDLPPLTPEVKATLQRLPIIRTTRDELWQVVGFKHVNGPAKWTSYAKAEYIANTHEKLGVPLDTIAIQIGDRHQTVRRLYRTISVLRQAERLEVYHRDNKATPRLAFTHLLTGLSYAGVKQFLAITDDSLDDPNPVPRRRKKQLGELLTWLFGDRTQERPSVIISQNPDLRRLDEVLQKPEAVDRLRATSKLDEAYEVSKGDERVFEEYLHEAKRALQSASGRVATGFRAERTDLTTVAKEIRETADELFERMVRKTSRRGSGGDV